MKKTLLAFSLALVSLVAVAGPYDLLLNQRNSDDTGNIQRIPLHPSTNGLLYFDQNTLLPGWVTLGTNLSISGGVLSVASTPQVNADWNASSGAAQILNKPVLFSGAYADLSGKPSLSAVAASGAYTDLLGRPSLATVATTGAYGDLTGQPALASVATSGAYADLTGKPVLATVATSGSYADLSNKPTLATVAATGNYADLSNKPSIPTVTAFNYGVPAARALAVSTSYQASDTSKAAVITVSPQCTASITLTSGQTCTMQARVAMTAPTCSTGTLVAQWTNGNTGALTVGLALNQVMGSPGDIKLPIGGYFILCAVSGTFSITSVEQSAG